MTLSTDILTTLVLTFSWREVSEVQAQFEVEIFLQARIQLLQHELLVPRRRLVGHKGVELFAVWNNDSGNNYLSFETTAGTYCLLQWSHHKLSSV